MSREFYNESPSPVEVYPVINGTDIILRIFIYETEEETEDGTRTGYTCEERQIRVPKSVTPEEAEERFAYYWELADGMPESFAEEVQAVVNHEPTITERIEAIEEAILEIAEVMFNA